MRSVRDSDGKRYLLVKRSSEGSRVRDPETGAERYLPNDDLEPAGGVSPLETAAAGIPESVRRLCSAVHNDRSLGLVVEVVDRGPLSVRELLDAYDLCESDLHGLLAECTAAGLLEEARVYGERGYDATDLAVEAVALLRDGRDPTPD
ncbi:DUF7346 family protein [Haloferacaceae archaeon DSL9]